MERSAVHQIMDGLKTDRERKIFALGVTVGQLDVCEVALDALKGDLIQMTMNAHARMIHKARKLASRYYKQLFK